jgi:hypothetical protein
MDKKQSPIEVPATLEGITRKKDRSVSFRFNSLFEVSNEDFGQMDKLFQAVGYLLFAEKTLTNEDIPDEEIETDIAKSQSTQIRDALWVLYKARGNRTEDKEQWNIFYRKQMQTFKARILDEVHKLDDN